MRLRSTARTLVMIEPCPNSSAGSPDQAEVAVAALKGAKECHGVYNRQAASGYRVVAGTRAALDLRPQRRCGVLLGPDDATLAKPP